MQDGVEAYNEKAKRRKRQDLMAKPARRSPHGEARTAKPAPRSPHDEARTAKPVANLSGAGACVDDDDTHKNFPSKCTFHRYRAHLHSAPLGF